MEISKIREQSLLYHGKSMKRICCICKNEFRYDKIKLRGPHKVKMCNYCLDTITFYVRDDIDHYGL